MPPIRQSRMAKTPNKLIITRNWCFPLGNAQGFLDGRKFIEGMPFMTAQHPSLVGIDIRAEIERLRREKNAVILAHYYQKPELQDLADFVGDLLELSRKAAETDADVIAFCGVKFMAEVAKILSPEKTVILPDMNAGCSLEDACPPARSRLSARRTPTISR
jgi:quinolinate synthase